ncbi:MAG: YgjV family protein [Bacilli bacterium]
MTCNLKYDLLVQFICLIGFYYLATSLFKKKKDDIIANQIVASFFFLIHYAFLDAMSGAVTSLIIMVRNVLFHKFKNQKLLSKIFYIVFIVSGIIFFDEWYSVLPIIGSIIYTHLMTKNKSKVLVGNVINASSWCLYNILAGSYAGVLTEGTVLIMALISIGRRKKSKTI